MGVFRQLGDPLAAAACLCQHHGQAYAELTTAWDSLFPHATYDPIADGDTVLSQVITTTERCCIVVNAATIVNSNIAHTALEIERPLGSIRTTQGEQVDTSDLRLLHHAAWEVLDPGTYTYFLVNRSGNPVDVYAAWMKIVASDCEG